MLSSISSGGSASTAQLSKMLSKLDTNNDGKIDKTEFVAGKPKGTSDQDAGALFDSLNSSQSGSMSQSDLLSAFQQMGAQMQSTLLQAQESSSSSDSDGDHDGSGMASKLDTNGDGNISQAEFLAGKPKGVSDDQANALWSKISNGADSVTQDQFTSAMKAAAPPPGGGHGHHHDSDGDSAAATPSTSSTSSTSSTASGDPGQLLDQLLAALQSGSASSAQPDTSKMFAKLDSNGDGTVSQSEFLAGKPKGVSDDQASALWSKISNGSTSVTKDQFISGMKNAGPPDQSSTSTATTSDPGQVLDQLLSSQSSSSGSTTATDSLTTAQSDAAQMLDQFIRAVSSYQNTAQQSRFSANSTVLSSILSSSVAA